MDQPIVDDTDITAGWIFSELAKFDNRIDLMSDQKIEVKRIGDGRAFLSRVFRLKFCPDLPNPEIPKSVVLKIPGLSYQKVKSVEKSDKKDENMDESTRRQIQRLIQYHNVECAFYQRVAPKLDAKFPVVKAFAIREMSFSNDGALMLEDCEDAKVIGYFETLTAKQVESVVIQISYFHAWSLMNESYDLMKDLDAEFKMESSKSLTTFCSMLLPKTKEVAPGVFDQLLDKLAPFLHNDDYHNYALDTFFKETALPKVLTHGDLWSHNILWKADVSDGKASDELRAIVDWQIVRRDNQMQDVARLLVNSCSAEMRKNSESHIIHIYKTHFDKNLREIFAKQKTINGISVDEFCSSITIEKLERAYRFAFLFEAVKAIMYLPLMNDALERGVAINHSSQDKAKLLEDAIHRTKSIAEDLFEILEKDHPEWLKN